MNDASYLHQYHVPNPYGHLRPQSLAPTPYFVAYQAAPSQQPQPQPRESANMFPMYAPSAPIPIVPQQQHQQPSPHGRSSRRHVADHHQHLPQVDVVVNAANGGGENLSRAEQVKNHCIALDPEFSKYLDDKGRISVKTLRETPKLRHLYKIYDRVSVQLCRAERRRDRNSAAGHHVPNSPSSSPPTKQRGGHADLSYYPPQHPAHHVLSEEDEEEDDLEDDTLGSSADEDAEMTGVVVKNEQQYLAYIEQQQRLAQQRDFLQQQVLEHPTDYTPASDDVREAASFLYQLALQRQH